MHGGKRPGAGRKPGSISVVDGDAPFELADGTPFSTRPRPSAQVGDVSNAVNATDPANNDKRIGSLLQMFGFD